MKAERDQKASRGEGWGIKQAGPKRVVALFAICLASVLLYVDMPLSSMSEFMRLARELRFSSDSINWDHFVAECRPQIAPTAHLGVDLAAYEPMSVLFPGPKNVKMNEKGGEHVVHLGDRVNIFMSVHAGSEEPASYLQQALKRFCKRSSRPQSLPASTNTLIGKDGKRRDVAVVTDLNVKVQRCDRGKVKGSYSLALRNTEDTSIKRQNGVAVTVKSCSMEGAMIAVNSALTQMFGGSEGGLLQLPLPYVIEDWPEYAWRGLMVDVARHFQPLTLLKRTIDGMALSRLNCLHLHLTDAEAFRLQLADTKAFPRLSALSASNNVGETYSMSELQELVAYAKERGVDIVPEVDVPAHVLVWAKAFPDWVVQCHKAASLPDRTPAHVYSLDISKPEVGAAVAEIVRQLASVFPFPYVHLGGDELHLDCWDESPSLLQAVKSRYHSTDVQAKKAMYKNFESEVMRVVRSYHKVPLVWSGVQDSEALPDSKNGTQPAIVEPWKCWSSLAARAGNTAASSGHKVLMSACWYLDFNHDWLEYFSTDVASALPSSSVVGGEAAVWTERIDHTNFECRLWPRAGAVAARLWGLDYELSAAVFSQANASSAKSEPKLGITVRTVALPLEKTRALLLSLVHYRDILSLKLGVAAAPVTFHTLIGGSGSSPAPKIGPVAISSLSAQKAFLQTNLSVGATLAADNKLQPMPKQGSVRVTAQCPSLCENMSRPLSMDTVRVSQVNVAGGEQPTLIAQYLAAKATEGTVLVGLCELNDWEKLKSDTVPADNHPQAAYLAAKGGFAHSHLMLHDKQPYHLGVFSAIPFEVRGQYGPPEGFQRGMLHVYLSKLRLHVIIAHLHAHDSVAREKEATDIARLVKKIMREEGGGVARIVVMGDLNTLSKWDAQEHDRMGLLTTLHRKDDSVWTRLSRKFLEPNFDVVNYAPMDILLDAGLSDACIVACGGGDMLAGWRYGSTDAFSRCMARSCLSSEPTEYPVPTWEWPVLKDKAKHPRVRLDYVLLSPALAQAAKRGRAEAGFDVNNVSTHMSDHFPMSVAWVDKAFDLF